MAKDLLDPKLTALILSIVVFAGSVQAAEKVTVFVSIAPQKYFVQQIGKNLLDVRVMVQPGGDIHTYEPKPRQMAAIAKARLYLAIGIAFEKARLKKIVSTNPGMRVVRTDKGLQKIPMATHRHTRGNHRDNNGLDPHVWLSPPLVLLQARAILNALRKIDPANRSAYDANYRNFASELIDLDIDLINTFAGRKDLRFMVFHPAWGYFADTYGLKQIPVEIEGKEPKPAQLIKLIEHAREQKIKIVFVQPQFSSRSADVIAKAIGGRIAFADPLAMNWSENLRNVAKKFKAAPE